VLRKIKGTQLLYAWDQAASAISGFRFFGLRKSCASRKIRILILDRSHAPPATHRWPTVEWDQNMSNSRRWLESGERDPPARLSLRAPWEGRAFNHPSCSLESWSSTTLEFTVKSSDRRTAT